MDDADGGGATEVLVWDAPTTSLRISTKRFEPKSQFDCRGNTGMYHDGQGLPLKFSVCGENVTSIVWITYAVAIVIGFWYYFRKFKNK